jgi:predicted MPP superfamily phosphohydrolase
VEVTLSLKRLPEQWNGLRIAQLSDFHYDNYFSAIPLRKAVEIVNGLQPDLVVLTGDFVTAPAFSENKENKRKAAGTIEPCVQVLAKLRSRLGLFACLGNHDVATDPLRVLDTLQAKNIPVLRNRSILLEREGARLWVAGVDDVIEGIANLDSTLHGIPENDAVVLLAHEPDFATHVAKFPVDVQLSGHTHGGQVRIPFLGAPVLPQLGVKFPMGFYQVGRLALYTNVGIGTVRLPVRLFCPPEITLFTLKSASQSTTV